MPLVVPGINSQDSKNTTTAPVIPDEQTVKSGVFDKPPQEKLAKAQDFTAMPGPVVPEDMKVFENKPSKEEMLEKAKELNK